MTDTLNHPSKKTDLKENINMEEYNVDDVINNIFNKTESNNWKPSDKMPLVRKEIDKLKCEMKEFLDNSDYEISAIVRENIDLCKESQELQNEMEGCKKEIEEVTMVEVLNFINNYNDVASELGKIEFSLNIVNNVMRYAKYVDDYQECKTNQNFCKAVGVITELLQFLDIPSDSYNGLLIYDNLKSAASAIWDTLLQDLNTHWSNMFKWSNIIGTDKNIVAIEFKTNKISYIIDVLYALNISKQLEIKVKEFSRFLLEEVLIPIIHKECFVSQENNDMITVAFNNKKSSYRMIIDNLRVLLYFLSKKLNVDFDNGNTVMKMIGKEICLKFCDILIKDCLLDTTPSNVTELTRYSVITEEIEDFQRFLTQLNFFPDENYSILDYADNLEVLFSERSSSHLLETARSIMLKDLSISISIGIESISPSETSENLENNEVKSYEEALKVLDTTLPKSLFCFPRCMISKSAQELYDLLYVIMEQAMTCSNVVCKRMYVTTRLIFELYDAVVPYHHENFLQTIPQYVALFHNNCMYLAHHLQTFGDQWQTLMNRELDYPVSFLDLVQKLRDLGYKHLTIHMQQQRKQILDNIRSSDLNCIVVKDVLGDNAEQAIRQCLRQLQLLKNVWIGVFPKNVFTRLMATLVNMFVDEIIHRVCSVEDISAEMATQLTEIYSIVVKKAPNLFQKPSDTKEYVKSWVKLQELILVLGGSLKDIDKRWNDGKGPLAKHFRTEELRNLVKALFQNTQFRANLLSKIK